MAQEIEQHYHSLFEHNPDPVFAINLNGYFIKANKAALKISGYPYDESLKIHFTQILIPEDINQVLELFQKAKKGKTFTFDVGMYTKQGEKKNFSVTNMPIFVNNNLIGIFCIAKDITTANRLLALKKLEKEVLKLNTNKSKSLDEVLTFYLKGIEKLYNGIFCSIQKIENEKLKNWLAPNLPESYLKQIEDLLIGPDVGSCGTAAYFNRTIIVDDISTSPLWKKFKDIALKEGLKSCWSFPISDSSKNVICTLAIYYKEIKKPDAETLDVLEQATYILKLIFENSEFENSLYISNERYKLIGKTTNDALWDFDLNTNTVFYGEGIYKIFGYKNEKNKHTKNFIFSKIHKNDKVSVQNSLFEAIQNNSQTWKSEYRYIKANKEIAYVLDNAIIINNHEGKPIRVIGAMQDVTLQKKYLIESELSLAISKIFSSESKLSDCLSMCLFELCKYMNTGVGEFWMTSIDNTELILNSQFVINGLLESNKKTQIFKNTKGLVGSAWYTKQVVYIEDIQNSEMFLRKDFAKNNHLKSAVAIPILYKNNVLAVICFYTTRVIQKIEFPELSDDLLRILASEIKRKKTENEFENFFTTSPDFLCVAGLDGYFKKVNYTISEALGYSTEELVSKPFIEFIHPDDRLKTLHELDNIIQGVPRNYIENRYITKTGSIKWISWKYNAVFDERLVYAIGRDVTDKISLEKSVLNEQLRFRKMFTEAPVSMCILKGKDHVFVDANQEYYALTEKKNIIGKTVREVFPEVAGQGYFEWLDAVYESGETFSSSETPLHLDKGDGKLTDQYISFMYQPYKNDEGEVEGIFYFGVDVTEQVLARKKIEESEKQYIELIENLPAAIYTTDLRGRIKLYNKAAIELWGRMPNLKKEFWCGSLQIFDLNGAVIPHELCPMAIAVKTGKPPAQKELKITRPDGSIRYMVPYPSPIFNTNRKVIGGVNVLIDITQKLEAEVELNKLSLIAKNTVNSVIITNTQREIEWVNEAFTKITGYTENEAIGKNIEQLLHGKLTSNSVVKYIHNKIKNNKSFECEIIKYTKSKQPIWLKVQGQPLFAENGKVSHYFDIETDITERKKAYEILQKKEAEVRKFAKSLNTILEEERAKIAREIHDEFGQQLSGLKMSLFALGRLDGIQEKGNETLKDIYFNLDKSIQSLRNISTELRPLILDTLGLFPSIEWLLNEFYKKTHIKYSIQNQVEENIKGKTISTGIFRIFQEALTNITKHAKATKVEIKIYKQDNKIYFEITDDGIGIDNSKSKNPFSMGILSMNERAKLIRAQLSIEQVQPHGTKIIMVLNLKNNHD